MLTGIHEIAAAGRVAVGRYAYSRPTDAYRGAGRSAASMTVEWGMGHGAALAGDGCARRRRESGARGSLWGLGLAFHLEATLSSPNETARNVLERYGGARLFAGTRSIRPGPATAYARMLAKARGLGGVLIRIVQAGGHKRVRGGGIGGSRSVTVQGLLPKATAVDVLGHQVAPEAVLGHVQDRQAQGLGQASMESAACVTLGQFSAGNFRGNALRNATHLPFLALYAAPILTATNPLAKKDFGKAGKVGAMGAISNAVRAALAARSVERVDLPFPLQRLWQAKKEARHVTH